MPSTNSHPSLLNALLSGPRRSFVDEVTAMVRELGDFSVPDGYEDETGFHFGPAKHGSRPPLESQNCLGEHI
jgi:hypothetical protein